VSITGQILLVAAIWLAASVCSVVAIVFAVLGRIHRVRISGLLALASVVVGVIGFTAWTPFGFLPQIGYTRSSDNFEFHLRSSWFFLGPLILGAIAALLVAWKQVRLRHGGGRGGQA
jgi:hypothetical protein